MAIKQDGSGKIRYTQAITKARDDASGTVVDTEFAIVDEQNVLKQIQFKILPASTTAGTLTLEASIGADATLNLTGLISSPFVLWIDGSRADAYTQSGTQSNPYKTIMGAVNRVIANQDNSADTPYLFIIMGPGTYAENIILESQYLTDLYFIVQGAEQSVIISPPSGNSLQSNSSNDTLRTLIMQDLVFNAPISMVGSGSGISHFLDNVGSLIRCICTSTQTITNAGDWEQHDGQQADSIVVNNSPIYIAGGLGFLGDLSLTNGSSAILETLLAIGNMTNDATSVLQFRNGSRIGSTGGSLTNAGTMTGYTSFIRSNIANSGTFTIRGALYKDSTMTNTGTIVQDVSLGQFNSFSSPVTTCTGSSQSIAHGLNYVPTHVLIAAQDTSTVVGLYTISEGTHTNTNIVLTGTSGLKVKVLAF